jgi:hypothetical protein
VLEEWNAGIMEYWNDGIVGLKLINHQLKSFESFKAFKTFQAF